MKLLRRLISIPVLIAAFAFIGCEEKGPMERAGENIDDAAKATGEAVKDAGEEVEDAVDN